MRIGDCEVEFLRVTHSMPDCVALAIHTPAGTIVLGATLVAYDLEPR